MSQGNNEIAVDKLSRDVDYLKKELDALWSLCRGLKAIVDPDATTMPKYVAGGSNDPARTTSKNWKDAILADCISNMPLATEDQIRESARLLQDEVCGLHHLLRLALPIIEASGHDPWLVSRIKQEID